MLFCIFRRRLTPSRETGSNLQADCYELADHQNLTLATVSRSIFAILGLPGSAAQMKTPTDCCANICRVAPIYPYTAQAKFNAIASQLYERPRKTLLFQTPSRQVRGMYCSDQLNPPSEIVPPGLAEGVPMRMQGDLFEKAAEQPAVRSRVTNHRDLLPGLDGRSASARRYRDLVNSYIADMGGGDQCSDSSACCVVSLR